MVLAVGPAGALAYHGENRAALALVVNGTGAARSSVSGYDFEVPVLGGLCTVRWSVAGVRQDALSVSMACAKTSGTGYLAFGIASQPGRMTGAHVVLGLDPSANPTLPRVAEYTITSKQASGLVPYTGGSRASLGRRRRLTLDSGASFQSNGSSISLSFAASSIAGATLLPPLTDDPTPPPLTAQPSAAPTGSPTASPSFTPTAASPAPSGGSTGAPSGGSTGAPSAPPSSSTTPAPSTQSSAAPNSTLPSNNTGSNTTEGGDGASSSSLVLYIGIGVGVFLLLLLLLICVLVKRRSRRHQEREDEFGRGGAAGARGAPAPAGKAQRRGDELAARRPEVNDEQDDVSEDRAAELLADRQAQLAKARADKDKAAREAKHAEQEAKMAAATLAKHQQVAAGKKKARDSFGDTRPRGTTYASRIADEDPPEH